jgi:hypothetical protein
VVARAQLVQSAQESIHDAGPVPRTYHQRRDRRAGPELPVFGPRRLQRSYDRRPHADDATTARSRVGNRSNELLGNLVALGGRKAPVEPRIPRRRDSCRMGEVRDGDPATAELEQNRPRERATRGGELEGPWPRGKPALHVPEGDVVANVRVLDGSSRAVELTPEAGAGGIEAEAHEPRFAWFDVDDARRVAGRASSVWSRSVGAPLCSVGVRASPDPKAIACQVSSPSR